MATGLLSNKRALIDKTNTMVVITVSVAAFIFVFSAVATKTLISQSGYQNRVISAKRTAVKQLRADITSTDQLKSSYQAFTRKNPNIIGGGISGTDSKSGDNAKIIRDALPTSYDFPALTTSLEFLLSNNTVKITNIAGTDDEVAQSANQSSPTPAAVAMPFQAAVTGDYAGIQNVIVSLERSIRPMQVQTLDITGDSTQLTLGIGAQTYYQPAKSLTIKKTVVK